MPELKRHFRAGRMNKDLDERLVPAGEYRNAENIEIATSEGSDVGAAQNVLGNTKKRGKTYNASSQTVTADFSNAEWNVLTSPKCIGSIKDTQNDKIYWFVASTNHSVIVEYDETKDVIAPVLVDKNSILNFSESYPITGINIIEGLLLWTDNQTEPKKIKISTDNQDIINQSNWVFLAVTPKIGKIILPKLKFKKVKNTINDFNKFQNIGEKINIIKNKKTKIFFKLFKKNN